VISAFHSKARQARDQSGNPTYSTQQALPNGQRLRYTYNNGQETLTIELTPEQIAAAERPAEPVPDQPCDILLAIDVLFDPATFVVGDIYHKVPYTTTTPGPPLYPNDPQYYGDYTQTFDYPLKILIDPNEGGEGHFGNWGYTHPAPDGTYNYDGYYHQGTFYQTGGADVSRKIPDLGGGGYTSGDPNVRADAAGQAIKDHNKASSPDIGWNRIEFTAYGGVTSNNLGGYADNTSYYQVTKWQTGAQYIGPRGPDVVTTNYHVFRERRTYLDILPVVGLRIASKDASKSPDKLALSVGDHKDETDALKAVVDGDTTAIQRTIAFADPAGGNHFYGASFTAKVTLLPGQPLDDVEIEVYIASSNVTKQNSSPGQEGSTFADDDSSMRYDVTAALKYRIQVREVTDTGKPPMVVRVEVKAEGKVEEFGPDDTSTVTSTTMDPEARKLDWRFATGSPKWQDGGKDPADPTVKDSEGKVDTMGKLLLETDSDTQANVAKTTDYNRDVPTEPKWKDPVTQMTLAKTIVWTPPGMCHIHGKAKFKDEAPPPVGGGGGPLGLPPAS
jgi:hypothetical protein